MKLTLRDIAKMAGVSPATVSNALNGRSGVSAEVQERIIGIARESGYLSGRETARTGKHVRLIIYKSHGMVVMDTPFFSELIESVQLECHQAGLELLISHISKSDSPDFKEQIASFCSEECAGIILLGTEMNSEELASFQSTRSPLVVLDNVCHQTSMHSVVMNNFEAGRLAAEALWEAGHRNIHHITSSVGFSNMDDRKRGYASVLEKEHIPVTDDMIWPVRPIMNEAYEDMKVLIKQRGKLPEAFFAANDIMAIGCMRAMTEAGYRIPEDISIIGMDDTSICQACTPQLSTVHVFRKELGQVVIHMLLDLPMSKFPCTLKTVVGVKLVMRGSVRTKT